tara:strand:- start:186 stop:533 length:348 start_codon:yes stop_codon:yes gene_type:complete
MTNFYEIGIVSPKAKIADSQEADIDSLMQQLAVGDYRARVCVEMPKTFSAPSMQINIWLTASTFPGDISVPSQNKKTLDVLGSNAKEALTDFADKLVSAYGHGAEISYVSKLEKK